MKQRKPLRKRAVGADGRRVRRRRRIRIRGDKFLRKAIQSIEPEIARRVKEELAEIRMNQPVSTWRDGLGRDLNVRDMEEGHLRNAISYAARRLGPELSRTVWLKHSYQLVRGLANLLEEAQRRGIQV